MAGPIRIAILADARNAVSGLNDTGRAADGLGTKFRGAAKAALKYAAAGAALAAGAAVVGLAKLAAGAAEDEAAATRLAGALKKSAGATDAQVAATEDYISKTGVALGVTDDQLRPALEKFARATGSVTEAQKATNLAMNVAAGSGQSLEAVSKSLAKAYTTGSVTALSKYGVAAKNADGSTKTLAQATDELGKKFGGAAADKANTLQGKIDRLKLIVSEAGETIGYKLIPVLTRFADYVVNKVIPTVIDIGGKARYIMVPAFEAIAAIVTGKVIPAIGAVIGFFVKYQDILIPVAAAIGAMVLAFTAYQAVIGTVRTVTAAYTAVQTGLNIALTANPIGLVVLALVGLAAGLVVAYKKSETFRDIVNGAFGVVKSIAQSVAGFFTNDIPLAFNKVVDGAKGVLGWVKSNWPTLLAVLTGPIGLAVLAIAKNWDSIKEGATSVKKWISDKFDDLVGFVRGLPGRISAASGGMFNGIRDAFLGALNYVIDKWNGLQFTIPAVDTHIPGVGKIGGFTLGTPDIPRLATGGIVTRPTIALIGEAGPEAVVPLNGRYGNTVVQINVSVPPTADPVSVGREVSNALDAYYRAGGRPAA